MGKYVLATQAERDIKSIGRYIAADNPAASERLVAEFYDAFSLLAEMPHLEHVRRDLTRQPVRFWPVRKRYLVTYLPVSEDVVIVRILDGHRDVENILG